MTNEEILFVIFLGATVWVVLNYLSGKAKINAAIKDVVAKHVHEIKMEQHGDITYWFDKTSDQFFAQGKTLDDIISQLKQAYPGHVFLYDVLSKQYLLVGPDFEPILVDDGETLAKKDFE